MGQFLKSFCYWLVGISVGFAGFGSLTQMKRPFHASLGKAKITKFSSQINKSDASFARLRQLPFSESIVEELEHSWEDLPKQAALVEETRGWRVVRLDPNSLFAKAGYHEGDLIPNDKVDASLATLVGKDNELAKRIFKILKHVSN